MARKPLIAYDRPTRQYLLIHAHKSPRLVTWWGLEPSSVPVSRHVASLLVAAGFPVEWTYKAQMRQERNERSFAGQEPDSANGSAATPADGRAAPQSQPQHGG